MKTKAFAYLRVSGAGQVTGDGFPRQREAIAKYAKAKRIDVVDEYRDQGVSGTTELDDRQALADLCRRLDENGVRLVLIERADRIARDLMVSEILLKQFRDRGVQVVEVEGGSELTVSDGEPTRVLIRQVLAAVAQFEKSCLVSKLRGARLRMREETGRCEGNKPFGHWPDEQPIVERIRQLKASGLSCRVIADRLNAEGQPTRDSLRPPRPTQSKRKDGTDRTPRPAALKWSLSMVQDVLERHS
jgi:DNA invertase Pin-like site-specific DNA recombinase